MLLFLTNNPFLKISLIGTPQALALDEEAALVKWPVNIVMSIPALDKTSVIHRETVAGFTDPWGLMKLNSN